MLVDGIVLCAIDDAVDGIVASGEVVDGLVVSGAGLVAEDIVGKTVFDG